MTPSQSVIQQIFDLAKSQHWLPLIAFLSLYARKLASPQSGFPISIAPQWLPSVSAAGGLVYGFVSALQQGAPIEQDIFDALTAAASTGFFDGILTAIFAHASAPAWARTLVGVFDSVAGTGGGSGGAKLSDGHVAATAFGVRESAKPAPSSPRLGWRGRHWAAIALAGASLLLLDCKPGQTFPANVPQDFSADVDCVNKQISAGVTDPVQIGFTCVVPAITTVIDIIKDLRTQAPPAQFNAKHSPAVLDALDKAVADVAANPVPYQQRLDAMRSQPPPH